jgi:hypothetical protein
MHLSGLTGTFFCDDKKALQISTKFGTKPRWGTMRDAGSGVPLTQNPVREMDQYI